MLTVKRKGYTNKRGVHVKPTTYKIADRGAPGRGKQVIAIKHPGTLGEGFMSKPVAEQHKILKTNVAKYGEKSTQGKLQALATFNKNVNPKVSKKAKELRSWTATNFEGKKYIGK